MPTDIVVPELGESLVEATVARWVKREGDHVDVGDVLVELETEKIDLEVGATQSGVLARIVRQDGEDVKIGELLGVIEEAVTGHELGTPQGAPVEPESAPVEPEATDDSSQRPEPGEAPRTEEAAVPKAIARPADTEHPDVASSQPARARTTPTARRVADRHAIDLAEVRGSGPSGRVTRVDVEAHLEPHDRRPPSTQAPAAAESAGLPDRPTVQTIPRREERLRMSRRRQTIARRLVEAQHAAATLTTFNEIDMGSLVDLRNRHKDAFRTRYGVGLGLVSFFVKASVAALRAFPPVNAEVDGRDMILKHYYDIGVAVGASGGLVVPVIRDADRLSFGELEQAIKGFARKAEDGTLSLDDLKGGTFTITNGGVFGSLLSTPILNPPQVGILGLHKIEDRAVVVDGQVVVRPMMYVALSYDHRIIDGLEAVRFLVHVKQLVEDPTSLMLEG